MAPKLSQHWQAFRQSPPGERFQKRYVRHGEAARGRSRLVRLILVVLGGFSIVFGFILFFVPGPGILFVAIGGGLVANESLIAARFFDWIEVKSRAGIAKIRSWSACRRAGSRNERP
jgi:hypothetical protein